MAPESLEACEKIDQFSKHYTITTVDVVVDYEYKPGFMQQLHIVKRSPA